MAKPKYVRCAECANYIPQKDEEDDCHCSELSDDEMFVRIVTSKVCKNYKKVK